MLCHKCCGEVKEISTDVIGSCDEDGVALFMEKKLKVKS